MRVGFLGLLQILFVGLKLGGVIAWPWVLVLLPLIAPALLFAVFSILLVLVAIVATAVK